MQTSYRDCAGGENAKFRDCFGEHISVVSIALFDTLLLREEWSHESLYEAIGECAAAEGLLPHFITPREFAKTRMHIGILLQNKCDKIPGQPDPSLKEIYASMPAFIKGRERCRFLELELTKKRCFINAEMAALVEQLRVAGKKIVVACDSVYSHSFINALLEEKGVSNSTFCTLYSSSHFKVSRRSGNFFRVILDREAITADQLVHIGSDLSHDVITPRKLGIGTIHYDITRSLEMRSMEAERLIKGRLCPEFASLRRISSCRSVQPQDKEEGFWFRFGASVLGPVLVEFSEWVLDQAECNGMRAIYPLMREGALLERLLIRAAQRRNLQCTIKPLYVSRFVIMFAGKTIVDESLIRRLIVRRGVTLARALEILGVEPESRRFKKYYDLEYYQFRHIQTKYGSLYDQLITHLTSPDIACRILPLVMKSQEMCRTYLEQECRDSSLTVDIGYSATIQRGVERILGGPTGKRKHLLLFASETPTLRANITEDPDYRGTIDLEGFFDTYGNHAEKIEEIYWRNRFLELLMMDERGSTVGYEQDGGTVRPVLKSMPSMTPEQLHRISACQEGILTFQKNYFDSGVCEWAPRNARRKDDLLEIMHRVICHPTAEEAHYLGSMLFDENNGADWVSRICEEADVQLIRDHGIDALIRAKGRRNILWPEGLVANALPDYSANNSLRPASEADLMAWMLVRMVIADGVAGVVVCGAGQIGRHTALYLKCCGIDVEAFADNNPILHDISIDNIKVSSLTSKFNFARYVVSSFAHRNAIMQQIKSIKGPECRVYAL